MVNVLEYVLVFICSCEYDKISLTYIQMLWINLIMDYFGSLTWAKESPPYNSLLLNNQQKKMNQLIMWLCGNILYSKFFGEYSFVIFVCERAIILFRG